MPNTPAYRNIRLRVIQRIDIFETPNNSASISVRLSFKAHSLNGAMSIAKYLIMNDQLRMKPIEVVANLENDDLFNDVILHQWPVELSAVDSNEE